MATKSNDIKSKLQAQGATVIDGKSANIVADNIEAFKALLCSPELRNRVAELFPCAFADGELQMDALLQSMGQYADNVEAHESYPISWRGKAEAEKRAQTMTTATLRPCIEESVGKDGKDGVFDSQNLYIEGDNLEVLKVLERSYAGQIKMIYIDPPYNTGNDFIYKDKYADGIQTYLEYTGQKDDKGNDKSTKKETSGASHSNWLSMMYPRLEYAKRLLSDDGVIFISIDDNEQANVIKLCNMIFGENNRVCTIIIENDARVRGYDSLATTHEYLCVYKKLQTTALNTLENNDRQFRFIDDEGGFDLYELRNRNTDFNANNRPNLYYPFWVDPTSEDEFGLYKLSLSDREGWIKFYPQESQGIKTVWRWGKEKARENLNKVIFGRQAIGGWQVVKKYRGTEYALNSVWQDADLLSDRGTLEVKRLFNNKRIFGFPKSIELIKKCLELSTLSDSIILDFFSGSASTAHSIMKHNYENKSKSKYIMVQIPEPCDPKTSSGKAALEAGFQNIAEIGKERIRRAGKAIKKEHPEANIDIGFKVFKLDSSNLKKWDDKPAKDAKEVENRLLGAQDMMVPGRSHLDVVYEYMLKYGLTLDWPVECVKVYNKDVYVVAGGMFMVCLDHDLDKEWAKELVQLKKKLDPADWRVLVADESFGNETNTRDNNAQNIFHTLCDAGLAPVNFIIA